MTDDTHPTALRRRPTGGRRGGVPSGTLTVRSVSRRLQRFQASWLISYGRGATTVGEWVKFERPRMYGRGTMVVQVEISRDRTPRVLTVGLDGALPEAEAEEFLWLDWAVVPRLPHSALAPPVAFAKATPLGMLVACYREPTLTPWGVQQTFPHPAVSPMAWKTGLALLEGQQLPFAVVPFVPFQAWLPCQRLDAVADLEGRWLATLGRHRDLLEYCRFKGVPVGITHEMDASTLEMPLNAHQREQLPLLIERFPGVDAQDFRRGQPFDLVEARYSARAWRRPAHIDCVTGAIHLPDGRHVSTLVVWNTGIRAFGDLLSQGLGAGATTVLGGRLRRRYAVEHVLQIALCPKCGAFAPETLKGPVHRELTTARR